MIRFKCIYCGQRILTPDDGVGKKGKCPHCQHILVVPKITKGRPAISVDSTESIAAKTRPPVSEWSDSVYNPKGSSVEISDELIEVYKESFGFLIPTYDKLSLFLMAVTLILLFAINIEIRDWMRDLIHHFRTEWRIYLRLSILLCFVACVYRFLTSVVKTDDEETDYKKKFMLFFAVLTNAAIGIIAGVYVLRNAGLDWLLVFPLWNIINSVLMLLMLGFKIIDEECISDRKATFFQIVLGLIAVLFILVLCNYVFKLYWAITLSICIVYTTSFDRALQNIFPGPKYGEKEQAA